MENKKLTIKFKHSYAMLLGILFIGLKITKIITWSWWWVLAPIYVPVFILISVPFFLYTLSRNKKNVREVWKNLIIKINRNNQS